MNERPTQSAAGGMTEPDADTLEDSLASEHFRDTPGQPHLFAVLECDRPMAGGARFALAGLDEVRVGRGPDRDATYQVSGGVKRLFIRVPGRSMSGTHARFVREEEGWFLEDARSTNGSFVNGARIERVLLQDGDILDLGHTLFILRLSLPTPPQVPQVTDVLAGRPSAAGLTTLLPALSVEFATLARFATSNLPLLLLGESGTGKEVVARAVHCLSGRSGPFVAINCGALAPNLIESQLFGHAKGAFSGASRDEAGFVRTADGGTLLLDEVGDLPLNAQPALLRVLQEQEVVPVGSARSVRVDVRVIAATHRHLEVLAQRELFRSDLLGRLDGYSFRLPRLNSRREDLGVLVSEILHLINPGASAKLTPEAGRALISQDWTFNVRGLVQQLKRGLILADGGLITKAHLIATARSTEAPLAESRKANHHLRAKADTSLRDELLRNLQQHQGSVADVARSMGKARMQIQRWMKRFGVDPGAFRPPGTARSSRPRK